MKGSYIGIIANDGPGLLAGLLGILKSGNSFVPINPVFPNDRIDFIIKDCGIKVLLTDRVNFEKAQQVADSNPFIGHLLCIDDEAAEVETGKDTEDGNQEKDALMDVDDPCYVIYTSGSTGRPKGVPISHRNLIPLFSWFKDYFGLDSHTRVMQNLSYTFDFGVFEILTTLIYGGCLHQLDKGSIGDFTFYSRYINAHFINTVHSTPVFFINVVSSARENMPSLQLVHLGGERLTGKIVKSISRVVPSECRVHNGYGPTEATINCSIFTLTAARGAAVEESVSIPIGGPTAWNILYILDHYHNPQPVGAAGELCVAGAGVANGYLNQPELTIEKFLSTFNRSYKSYRSYIPKKLYKTGDLVRWLVDGNIEFLGRIDFQVKVRGFRIELGEIENCLLKHPGIEEAVVIAREHENGSHYLCAYVVFNALESLTVSQLREHLLEELPDYMIPAYFIPLEQIPLTPNGKVDRKALPGPDEGMITTGVEYAAPVTDLEKKLVKIWQGLLKIEKIGLIDDFFELGGDSITANQCIARIREELQAEVALRKFFERPYIKALSEEIGKQERKVTAIPRASRDGLIPLSFVQERLWFLQELDAENAAYFVPRVIRIKGKIETKLFERTFTEIIRRHEILRTRFLTVEGVPVQHIDPPYVFKIPLVDWSSAAGPRQPQGVADWLREEGQRKFNFETGPMLRVTLLKLKPAVHLLVLTEHHLVHDGWTQGVLLREFVTIYTAYSQGRGQRMPELPIQYADFAIWQRELLQGKELESHLAYWKKKLAGLPPVLELPFDRPRPAVISGQGALLDFHLPAALTRDLDEFSRRNDITLFMTMLAVFKVLLYRYSGMGDLCVGTGIANRRYKEMEGMLGMVINSLPLRTRLEGDLPFNRLLHRVKETCLEGYQHEDTPFGKIVEAMQPERSLSYSPLFQVLYSFMDTPTEDMRLPGLELELLESHNRSSKFDINVVVVPPVEEADHGETLIEWEYSTDIFKEDTMNRMIRHYIRLLEEVIHNPEKPVSQLAMIPGTEIRQVLYTFNETALDYPFDKTIHQLFEEQVEKTPDQIALVGGKEEGWEGRRVEGKKEEAPFGQSVNAFGGGHLTYKELDERANHLAQLLKEKGVDVDAIVGIMVERSIEMMVGLLGILKAGGAYLPIDPDYPEERINYMLKDSKVMILVEKSNEFSDLIMEGPSTLPSSPSTLTSTSTCQVSSTNLAYVIYTSGSTGKPKGVMVQHGNVVNFITGMTAGMDFEPGKRILGVTTITFDIFVLETWLPLSLGMQVAIADEEQRRDPELLSEVLIRQHIDILQVTPSRLILLFNSDPRLICLQGVRELIVGGEAFPAHLLNHLQEVYPGKFYNLYGPTETTVWSTFKELTGKKTITIGAPIANTRIYILGKYNQLQPPGIPGELLIGGDGVTRGYLNNPELTNKKFCGCFTASRGAVFQKSPPMLHGARRQKIYKTGDLARWLADGNIEFLGRMDHQVKVRGFRIELGEIENQLKKHEEIKEAAVVALETKSSDKYLAAYLVSNTASEISIPGLREYLAKTLPNYMLPAYFVQMEEMPLSSSGKTDRKALPLPETKAYTEYVAPRNEVERKLAKIWSGVLHLESSRSVGIDDNFFVLGGHSLTATRVAAKMHKTFNVKLPLMQMFKRPTIKKLSEYIREAAEDKYGDSEAAEKREYYALSSAQRRLFVLQQMDEGGISESPGTTIAYNISTVLELEGQPRKKKLEETLKALISRHESLRTSFAMVGEEPVQKIHDEVKFKIEGLAAPTYYAFGGQSPKSQELRAKSYIKNFIRSFDLSSAPLLRVGFIQEENTENKYILIVDMHHIISDGISTGILAREFMDLYSEKELPLLKIQYKDYVLWQNSEKEKERLSEREAWWMKEFIGEIPVLNLPLDYPRPTVQSFAGSRLVFETGREELKALRKLALSGGATLYMVLLTAYSILLSRLSGQEEIVIGAPVGGRRHPELESIMGMFVNTLALRTYPTGNKTFNAFLNEMKEKTLEAFENQEYPFEDLVEQVIVTRDPSRNPLFDTAFILQNVEIPTVKVPGLTLTPCPYDSKIAKFDLTLQAFEREPTRTIDSEGKLEFVLEYCTRLFKCETIKKFVGYFKKILSEVIEKPGGKISGIEIISEAEKRKIIMDFNDTAAEYPGDKTIAQLFEEQVERIPDQIALVGKEEGWQGRRVACGGYVSITYKELNEKSNQLAHLLGGKGIKPDTIVAIMVERSVEMIIGILGILKAGGAYLPIAPDYPVDRVNYILADSAVKVLVTTNTLAQENKKLRSSEAERNIETIFLDSFELPGFSSSQLLNFSTSPSSHLHLSPAPVTSLAYIMYTSGSTGTPKGTMVEQVNVVRLVKNTNYLCFHKSHRILQTGVLEFDASTFEIWGTLLNGGQLVLASKEAIITSHMLKGIILAHHITTMWLTAPLFNQLVGEDTRLFGYLRYLLVGGDVLSPLHINRVRKCFPYLKIINGYGPTENTTFSTTFLIDKEYSHRIPIGKPIANSTAYIVDKNNKLQPIGTAGELIVGGDGVCRGYLNNPELTAEKFVEKVTGAGDRCRYINKKFLEVRKPFFKKVFGPRREKIYKTGDLARWLPGGNIEFLGRMDRQVKVRGFRIEPGGIETQLLNHKQIKEAIVIPGEDHNNDKYLCAYIVLCPVDTRTGFSVPGVREYLEGQLPHYMVPSYFITLEKIPLTPNGKTNIKALPAPGAGEDQGTYTPPGNKLEEDLAAVWAEVMAVDKARIGIDTNFFDLGGHSLKATILISRIHKKSSVKIPLVELFKNPTIRGLSLYIGAAEEETCAAINPVEEKEYYPLSSAQKRLYILEQVTPGTIAYNMPQVLISKEPIDGRKLEQSFRKLIQKHESLRTSFHMTAGQPVQKIHDEVEFKIEYYDKKEAEVKVKVEEEEVPFGQKDKKKEDTKSQELSAKSYIEDFIRPFDLSRVPLVRVGLIKIDGKRDILIVDLHHIVTDGTSQVILTRDLMAFYPGGNLSLLRLQYKDYAQWQSSETRQAAVKQQETWWLDRFRDEVPVPDLPLDYPRPLVQRFEGDRFTFIIGEVETNGLKTLASREGATLFIVLLTVFYVFLSKISGKEDIIVGTPVAGRRHADLKPIVGMFVNTLALRNQPRQDLTYRNFLQYVRENTLQALENQEYPFEDLVEQLSLDRDTGRNPLFDVLFTLHNLQVTSSRHKGFTQIFKPYPYRFNVSKFDMTFAGTEREGKLTFMVEYSTCLFKPETIQRFVNFFQTIVSGILAEPGIKLSEIEMIDEEEKKQILVDFNDTATGYPREKTIHELFEQQMERTPDQVALTGQIPNSKSQIPNKEEPFGQVLNACGGVQLSYKELDKKSNRLAQVLRVKGVHPDTIVGIMMERSIDMIVVLIAILKAGGAYLPINPEYPEERIKYMLADSSVEVLVTTSKLQVIEVFPSTLTSTSTCQVSPTNLAYITYTSGSTGKPKGVMVEHRGVVRLVKNTNYMEFKRGDKLLPTCALEFDVSTFETWGALLNGLSLYLLNKGEILAIDKFKEFLWKYRVDVMWLTSSLFNQVVQTGIDIFAGLKRLLVGGEALSPVHINQLRKRYPRLSVINGYGPTENTTFSTTFEIDAEYKNNIPIGKPIANSTAYIVDKYHNLQPIGIVGELLVGGDGVARGYLNNPELTAKRFLYKSYRSYMTYIFKNIYKTGDLARWLSDGSIEFLGRMDQQVKIRGFRIEPGEIENQLSAHEAVKETVVIAGETGTGDKYLCAYIVLSGTNVSSKELKEYLSRSQPAYMVPSFFVFLDKIPLTPNGKIDGKALPVPGVGGPGEDFTAPRDEIERQLAKVWADILNLDRESIGIDANFFDLGGHSLKAVTMTSKIHQLFHVKILLANFFKTPFIRSISQYIRGAEKTAFTELENVEEKEFYPLSFNQGRLYFIHQTDPQSPAYNMPAQLVLAPGTGEKTVENVLRRLMERHESLRTSIRVVNNEPVQFIAQTGALPLPFEFIDISSRAGREKQQEREEIYNHFAASPFDLETPPLFRSVLVKLAPDRHELIFNLHHIISDGWSLEVLKEEFDRLYQGYEKGEACNLEPLKHQYKNYAQWQNRLLADDESVTRAKASWKKHLSGNLSVLHLPYDMPPSPSNSRESASYCLEIPGALTIQLRQMAQEHHVSLFMVLLAGFNLLLSRVTGQMDIIMAIPAAARQHEGLQNIIGMFVNTLILRNTLDAAETFSHFFKRLRANTLQVLEYQSYPLELICSELKIKYPDISVFFNMVNIGNTHRENAGDFQCGHMEKVQEAKFDLVCYLREYKNGIKITCHYFKELFIPKTIEKIMHLYLKVLEKISHEPGKKIGEYNLTGKRRELKRSSLS